ncbi:MAG: M48 family metalloprotease [Acidobacteriaceae bacterium]|nr:M48 family metalloprotease [Acidobacteriaceae bacterium]
MKMERENEQAKSKTKPLLWLIGVPIALLLVGVWQWSRVPSVDETQGQIAEYRAAIQRLDEMMQAHSGPSWATVVVEDENGNKVEATLLKSRMEKAIRELESTSGFNDATRGLQKPLATAAMACSALALLWACLGLAYQRRMGTRAIESREQLLAAFVRGKELLPVYMIVMVALLFGAAIAVMVYELMPVLRHQSYDRTDMRLMIVVVIFSALLLYYGVKILIDVIRAARRPLVVEPLQVMGRIVTREETPQLWAFVAKVAQRVGAAMPDAIVVGLNEGFFVTEYAVRLLNGVEVPKGRVLYLPLPYMAFMDAPEVAAVVGHELGHFIGEDTLYSQRFSPIYTATVRQLHAVAGADDQHDGWRSVVTRPATMFGEMFLDSFHTAVRFWSRKRELAADAVGAQVAGAKAVATSLLRITALEPHVTEALATHWDSAQAVAGGVLGHVRQLVAAKGMVDPRARLENRQSHPFDTHPELAVRLDAVSMPVNDELLRRAMDPAGSDLLREFGLEAQTAATSSQAAANVDVAARVTDISATLQSELASAAAANRQAKIQDLSAMVRAAQTVQPVFSQRISRRTLIGVLVLVVFIPAFLAVVLGAVFLLVGKAPNAHWIGLAVLTPGLGAIALGVWVLKRKGSSASALVIRPDGLQLFNQPAVLAWSAINDLGFTESNGVNLMVRLDLDRQVPAPQLGVSFLRARYVKDKHQLFITLNLNGGKQIAQVRDTLIAYWRACHAKAELQRMGVTVE